MVNLSNEITFRGIKPRDNDHQDIILQQLHKFFDASDPDDIIVITFTRIYCEGEIPKPYVCEFGHPVKKV